MGAHRPSPSGGASFPARSRLTRYPGPPQPASASHAPLRSSRICAPVQQAVGASGHFRSGVAIRAAAAVEELPWQGRGRGKARAGRGVKPEPPRGASPGRRREKRSRGRRGARVAPLAQSLASPGSGDASASGPHRGCQPWRQLLLRGQRRGCPLHGERRRELKGERPGAEIPVPAHASPGRQCGAAGPHLRPLCSSVSGGRAWDCESCGWCRKLPFREKD